jgi:hypothetical protein
MAGAGFFAGALRFGAGAGAGIAGAGFFAGALRFGAAFLAFFFFGAAFLATFFVLAGAAFFFFTGFFFAFAFDFFAMIVLPILELPGPESRWPPMGRNLRRDQAVALSAAAEGCTADRGLNSRSRGGHEPPVAQSISSTVCTAGSSVPALI